MDFLVHHTLRTSASRWPGKEALVHGRERLSFGELARKVNRLANGLLGAGIRRGDRVGIYLDASMPQVLSFYATSAAGAVYVPINRLLHPEQVTHIVNDCAVRALIVTPAKLEGLLPLLDKMPSVELLVLVDGDCPPGVAKPSHALEQWLETGSDQAPTDRAIDKDIAGILYTSGSTGKPKGVVLTHANVIAGGSIVSTYLGITHSDRIYAVLPFSFDAGMNQMITAIQQGATLVLDSFLVTADVVDILLKERITGLAGVPMFWSLLTARKSVFHTQSYPDLRYITNTGGAMPQVVLAALRKALPTTKVFLMYGLTEAFRSTYLPPEELDRRPGSMGRAIPNTEILLVNEEGGLCEPGEVGELVHRGPTVSLGYWGQPELTQRVLRPNPFGDPSERVCYSGDLVRMDEEGFLYFVGRRDTLIKSCGFRISPTEVEEILFKSKLIREAAVLGVPDDLMGQSIHAFVVPQPGAEVDEDALIAHCKDTSPHYMVPRAVTFVDELPKTSSGKMDYTALRKREEL